MKKTWGWSTSSLIERHARTSTLSSAGKRAEVLVQMGRGSVKTNPVLRVTDTPEGVKIVASPLNGPDLERDARLRAPINARVRDVVGQCVHQLERLEVTHAVIDLQMPEANVAAAILGIEIALYRYKRVVGDVAPRLGLSLLHNGRALKDLGPGRALGQGVNLARHLVNVPANELNPVTYADFIKSLFADVKHVTVEIWDEVRLRKENCGLLLAVGQASATPPRLVRVQYRPPRAKKAPAVALVGKGITFDTGGLDIKPAAGMRLMKKDMGGSAAVLGAVAWAAAVGLSQPIDAYVALAENAISSNAFRPGDVFTARNGLTVEITNTDAEGRLVLADALDVAIKAKPRAVVDVATLTGAIKVALGAQIAGLFTNDDKLGQALAKAGTAAGDPAWVMPLAQRYRPATQSAVADMVNSVESGFGGAITAALFLERFVGEAPWAHLDIYAWKDSPEGAWAEAGGSGQGVMLLAEWLGALA